MATGLNAYERKLRRCVWLGIVFASVGSIAFAPYHEHFGSALSTYNRDLRTMRRIGFSLVAERHNAGRVRCTRVEI